MYNSRYQKEAEKAVIDCRKTLFECSLERERITKARDLARVYMENVLTSSDISMETAIRMQNTIEDRYYTEEGGILSTMWETIKEMFRKLKAWLFGEDAPSTQASDYPVKQVKASKPADAEGIEGVMYDIERLTRELGGMDDVDEAEKTATEITEKLANALKPTPGKAAALISITLLIGLYSSAVKSLKNAEKTVAELEAQIRDMKIAEEERKKAEKKLGIINKITGALTRAQKWVMDLLHKATGKKDPKDENAEDPKDNTEEGNKDPKDGNGEDNKDPKDNTEEGNKDPKDGNGEDNKDPKDNTEEGNKDPKDGNGEEGSTDGSDEELTDPNAVAKDDAKTDSLRGKWFVWKFRYACTKKGLTELSKNIKPEIFPAQLRDTMSAKDKLTPTDLKKIGSVLGVDLTLLPDNYKKIVKEAKEKAEKEASGNPGHWFNLIPSYWWTLANPYRLSTSDRLKCLKQKKNDYANMSYEQAMVEYGKAIGYVETKNRNIPSMPNKSASIGILGWY